MINVLITGSSGYIGSATIDYLNDSEFNIFKIDIDDDFSLLNFDRLRSFIYENKIEIVLHLAAFKSITESKNNPIKYLHNNVSSSLNLISICEEFNIPLVNASSAAVYNNTNPYSNSKILVENFLDYSKLKYINLRYFNIGGLIQAPGTSQTANLFDIIRNKYLNNETLTINVNDSTRNYTHIKDIAKFNVRCLRDLIKNDYRKTLDVYTRNTASVEEIVEVYRSKGVNLNCLISHSEEPTQPIIPGGEGLIVDSLGLDDIIESEIKYGIRLDNRI